MYPITTKTTTFNSNREGMSLTVREINSSFSTLEINIGGKNVCLVSPNQIREFLKLVKSTEYYIRQYYSFLE